MKKLFSYLLISSMVVLSSCTNYDDQFDDLNAQINTLKSQIEGFSSLSSGLTALQGTVASLQTAINNIPVTPATDISGLEASLATLSTTVEALQASLANAATAAEVAALQTALAAAQSDLTDLLAANNVYTPDATNGLVINSASSLTVAESLGNRLAIINGKVTITNTAAAAMDQTKLQAVVDKMVTVTGSLNYTHSGSATVAGVTFNKLSSAGHVHLDQEAPISLPELATTGTMTLTSDVKVTSVSLPNLTSASFAGNAIDFSKATSIDLSSLASYDPATLTITGSGASAGFDLKLAALNNVSSTGVTQSTWTLNVVGTANTLDLPLMTKGTITANDAKVIKLPLFEGTLASSATVNHVDVTLGKSKAAYTGGPKLEKVDITGIKTSTAATATGPAYAFGASDKLTTATIAGEAASISFNASTALETAVISANATTIDFTGATSLTSATVSGNSTSITFSGNSDLTSVSLTGGTSSVTVNDADELLALDLSHTTKLPTGGTQATLIVTGNEQLASLKADKVTKVGVLKITGNPELASVSFDAITAPTTAAKIEIGGTVSTVAAASGAEASPSVSSTTVNNLHAQQITQAENPTSTTTAGTITTDSGLADLAAYIVAAKAVAGAKIFVAFDQVDKYVAADNAQDLEVTYGATTLTNTGVTGTSVVTLANVYPSTAIADKNATVAKRSWVVENGSTEFNIYANGVRLITDLDLSTPASSGVVDILSADALARADGAGVTLQAKTGGNAEGEIVILATPTAATGERYSSTDTLSSSTWGLTASDTLTVKFGNQSVTLTGTTVDTPASVGTMANAILTAWSNKYAGTATAVWSLASSVSGSNAKITATALDKGSSQSGVAAYASASVASESASLFDYINGATIATADNITVGDDIIVTLIADTAGETLSEIGNFGDGASTSALGASVTATGTNVDPLELSSTLKVLAGVATPTTADAYPTESRSDVTIAENTVSATACTACVAKTDVLKFNTTNWTWGS